MGLVKKGEKAAVACLRVSHPLCVRMSERKGNSHYIPLSLPQAPGTWLHRKAMEDVRTKSLSHPFLSLKTTLVINPCENL